MPVIFLYNSLTVSKLFLCRCLIERRISIYERKSLIPRRTEYALTTTIHYGSSWSASWDRIYRQVFWLSDGRRDLQRIAELLHKPDADIEQTIKALTLCGYTSLEMEKRSLSMDIVSLKQSFYMITSRKEAFAHSFYQRLFSYYPEIAQLFAYTDMKRQESSLMATLAAVIAGIERGDNLIPTVQKLGSRHYQYGVKPEHYALVGSVLLETFNEYLGQNFTAQMQDAWNQAYELISEQMIAS
jgi:hemoglobin-like flavoprotein